MMTRATTFRTSRNQNGCRKRKRSSLRRKKLRRTKTRKRFVASLPALVVSYAAHISSVHPSQRSVPRRLAGSNRARASSAEVEVRFHSLFSPPLASKLTLSLHRRTTRKRRRRRTRKQLRRKRMRKRFVASLPPLVLLHASHISS
jgi:hypothetical protein